MRRAAVRAAPPPSLDTGAAGPREHASSRMPRMARRVRRARHQGGWHIGPGSGRRPVRGLQTVDRSGGHPS
eukprot:8140130-Alexandrium_andersonii.AAC.1